MNKQVLFIHGGGELGYEIDNTLKNSLQANLGDSYKIYYPKMQTDVRLPDFGWLQQIGKEIELLRNNFIIVGHSFGASLILKFLSENEISKSIKGIFLISTPFWSGNEDWVRGLKLKENFIIKLPKNIPIFLYHARDDTEISISHLLTYKQIIYYASVRELDVGGHQLNNDLSLVAQDIKSL